MGKIFDGDGEMGEVDVSVFHRLIGPRVAERQKDLCAVFEKRQTTMRNDDKYQFFHASFWLSRSAA